MTQIEIVLLGLLYEKDRYGYEIEAVIEERQMRNWTKIGFSSIYNSLNNLEKKGWIGWRNQAEYGSPARKVYYVNESFRETVLETIEKAIHSPQRLYSEFSIGLAFSNMLTKEALYECLTKYRESLENRRLAILHSYEEQPMVHNTIHIKALFTHPLKLIVAEIEWLDDLLGELKENNKAN